jgi:stage II sporulation protein D
MFRFLFFAFCAVSAGAQTLRVGVFTLFHPTQLEIGPAGPSPLVLQAGHAQFVLNGEPGRAKALVRLENGQLRFGSEWTQSVAIAGRDGGATDFILSVPGKITRQYHGTLTISPDARQLVPVVSMDIETAAASIVAAESLPGAAIEALKAQAVVARSFLYAGGRHRDYDFCDTTHCQFLRQPPTRESRAFKATDATRGLILTWHHQTLAAMYSSRCGGTTSSLRETGISSSGYPYFAVSCAYCRRHPREGAGHGVGMCQYGAAGMAAEGATFSAILLHYYPETQLASISSAQNTKP